MEGVSVGGGGKGYSTLRVYRKWQLTMVKWTLLRKNAKIWSVQYSSIYLLVMMQNIVGKYEMCTQHLGHEYRTLEFGLNVNWSGTLVLGRYIMLT